MATPKQNPGQSKQDYATPTEFLRATQRLLGIETFSIDLAASQENTVATLFYDEATDSLAQDWRGITGWAWLNPPYAHIESWVRKAWESKSSIAVLIPASVGANWWRDWVHKKAEVHFLNGRLAFMRDRPKWLYPKDCALLLYQDFIGLDDYNIWNWRI